MFNTTPGKSRGPWNGRRNILDSQESGNGAVCGLGCFYLALFTEWCWTWLASSRHRNTCFFVQKPECVSGGRHFPAPLHPPVGAAPSLIQPQPPWSYSDAPTGRGPQAKRRGVHGLEPSGVDANRRFGKLPGRVYCSVRISSSHMPMMCVGDTQLEGGGGRGEWESEYKIRVGPPRFSRRKSWRLEVFYLASP